MTINCHIAIQVPDGDNICLVKSADLPWSVDDYDLRQTLGIPGPELHTPDFWEHERPEDYQRILDAASVHKLALQKELEEINEQGYLEDLSARVELARVHYRLQIDISRIDEWVRYYEIAAALVKLNHEVICYSAPTDP